MEINISRLFGQRYPRLARVLPPFALRPLQELLHEEDINEIFRLFGDLPPDRFLQNVLRHLDIEYTADFSEQISGDGRYIFVSNHPFGGIDGMVLADMLIRRFGDVRVVVNRILSLIEPLQPLWIPVIPNSRQSTEVARLLDSELMGDRPIATFPAGLCSRRTNGVIADPVWKPTFIRKAYASRRSVVPVFFEGELSKRFYHISRLRNALGIKTNIESILLADELFRQRGSRLYIRVGDPIPTEELQQIGIISEQVQYVRERTYALSTRV